MKKAASVPGATLASLDITLRRPPQAGHQNRVMMIGEVMLVVIADPAHSRKRDGTDAAVLNADESHSKVLRRSVFCGGR